MKKAFIRGLACCLLLATKTQLQAQNRVGLFAGPQVSWAKYRINEAHQPVSSKYGLAAGLTYKVAFDNQLYFSPALFYSQKGYRVVFNQQASPPSRSALNNDTKIHTLEVALLLQYDFSKKPGHFFVKGGPSFDISLSGNERFDTTGSHTISRPMVFGFTSYGYSTTSMNLHFGYEARGGWFFSTFYSHGMGDFNNADAGPDIRHRLAGIHTGFYLGRNKKQ